MKIFISWSGKQSNEIAVYFSGWIKNVIQAATPWISTSDINSGSVWFSQIFEELKNTSIGIICVTKENINSPWMHFEAGALAKSVDSTFVCPIVYGMSISQLRQPLAQFSAVSANKDGVLKLVKTINSVSDSPLEETRLSAVFDKWWPDFEEFFSGIENAPESTTLPPRQQEDILEEILENTREQLRREQERLKYVTEYAPKLKDLSTTVENTQKNLKKQLDSMDKGTDDLYGFAISNGVPNEIIESIKLIIKNGELGEVIKDIPGIIRVINEMSDSNDALMSKLVHVDEETKE